MSTPASRINPARQPAPRRSPGDKSDRSHLQLVDPRAQRRAARQRRTRLVFAIGIVFTTTVLFGLVYLHVVLAQRQIELDHLTTVEQSRQSTYESLRLKVAQLESPQNIISEAEDHLGMVQPSAVTYVTLPPGVPAVDVPTADSGGSGSTLAAPPGDADWAQIKAELAANP